MGLKQNELVRRNMAGFTLVELILVMAIVGILAVVGIGSFTQATVKSIDTQRKSDLNQVVKALESFNNDVGRYPDVLGGVMTCPLEDGSELACPDEIYAYIGDTKSTYMAEVPADPDSQKKYVYVPDTDLNGYSLYAALQNLQDKDVVVDGLGNTTDWGVSCGSVQCNFKIIATGLVRIKP